ncbi:MAG TPA: glycosyltransferase family 1 protein [Actinomycetota bacterium]|nr:glycosyltransferase family 1 protein [Actinomycetota bacterium]
MRVAYDAGPVMGSPTGVGRYAGELARALEARRIELHRYAVSLKASPRDDIEQMRFPATIVHQLWRVSGRPFPERLHKGCDLIHATNFVLPPTRVPGVLTVHDLSFHRDDVFPGGHRLRKLVPWSLERAAVAVVPTTAVGRELEERHGFPGDRTVVTHEGVAPVFFGASPLSDSVLGRMGIPGPFALAVGTIEPRKNLARLLEAWASVQGELKGWRLVVAGPRGWGPELPETPGVMPIGYVPEETLPGLMAAAEIFCYPSLYEGFGLPPLEAMAAGTACIAGRHPAAEEVLGEEAILVDPHRPDEIATALVRLAADDALRARRALLGRSWAARFTWEATASATIEAYERALAHT